MKPLFPLSIALVILASAPAPAAEPATGHRPVLPHRLITLLPEAPPGWTMTRSTAESQFENWLQTNAVREFRQVPTEETAGPPAETRITIVDTAGFPESTSMFDDFAPGREENYEKKVVGGHPAFLVAFGEREHETILLVGERFLVTVVLENQAAEMRKRWLERLDLDALGALPRGELIEFPEIVRLVRIDQLRPERNRAYTVATTSASRLEAELVEEAPETDEE